MTSAMLSQPIMPTAVPSLAPEPEHAWRQVLARDARADGRFVYAVATTKIFCRPTCPSRRPHRHNVRFFATPEEAREAGFRPCRRCLPEQTLPVDPNVRTVRNVARRSGGTTLPEQARAFQRILGVSPGAFTRARRLERFRAEVIRPEISITDALYEAGFTSSSRLYERSADTLGMTPTALKQGGRGERIAYAIAQSALGPTLVARTARGVCAIEFADTPEALLASLRARFPAAQLTPMDAELQATVQAVAAAVGENPRALALPLDIRATAFQLRVWQALRQIPRGETRTYTQIAQAIGSPASVRAVAAACGANPVAIAIPCHRVIGKDGSLTGYRWGLERKRALLDQERKRALLEQERKRPLLEPERKQALHETRAQARSPPAGAPWRDRIPSPWLRAMVDRQRRRTRSGSLAYARR